MVRDDRFYAFIVAHTSRSRSRIRRFCVHKRWLKLFGCLALAVFCAAAYGFYGLTQQAAHMRIERENEQLRAENERQRQQLNNLNNRVEAVEDASRRLAEMSGVSHEESSNAHENSENLRGAGGPALPLSAEAAAIIESKTAHVEQALRKYEAILRERAMTPAGWPVEGNLTDSFGGRHNPFGGASYEFHPGQDIAVASGTPVVATANGTVIFAGWQNGYGQVVVIDHGDGLTSRYGHLSHIDTTEGQTIKRGEVLGRVGSTGRSTGPHLHYEIRLNDEPIDPTPYLPLAATQTEEPKAEESKP